ncbi:hypothetical protein GCM10011297_11620 [Bacterioplanes sanyensis]|uniref:hypothetical protein n=1 Tax=Bacterioplanes sanyensis TaxID=1249553 RepID=UPI001674FAE9|nr:hypothetical protein [Bacterioplanes sanyensis]GGY40388.1 hypothetical protein GCM10011297_11620 [Bacterioplanes sanyensis]
MTSDIHRRHDGRTLPRSEVEKRKLEHDAARLFMRRFEQDTGQPMRHIWHNEPRKPDTSCFYQGRQLDLEIAHLYASEDEAKWVSGRQEHDPIWWYLQELLELSQPQQLKHALGRLLASKASKHYDSERVWLVIRNASPAWSREQITQTLHTLNIDQGEFEQIWLLPDFAGEQPLIQIQ